MKPRPPVRSCRRSRPWSERKTSLRGSKRGRQNALLLGNAAGGVLANVEGWLRQGIPGNCSLEPAVIEPPKLLKGETLLDALDRVRRRGREIKAALHTVRSRALAVSSRQATRARDR